MFVRVLIKVKVTRLVSLGFYSNFHDILIQAPSYMSSLSPIANFDRITNHTEPKEFRFMVLTVILFDSRDGI